MNRRLSATVASLTAAVALILAGAPPVGAATFLTLTASGFTKPVFVTNAGDSRLFVVEQTGRIKIIGGGTFLDLSSRIATDQNERGLLGLAFHPDYAVSGTAGFRRFYVDYTRAGDGATVIAEYRRSVGDANVADPASARTVLVISQPYKNHNAGWIGFLGHRLYIATGDGGSAGDPGNRAQSKSTLLGKILRINPLDPDGSGPLTYKIPASNPFVGVTGRDEIWSRGLRNPWRCSFDRGTGYMWCGDAGQEKYEELNRQPTGWKVNYGWRLLEGFHYYNSPDGASGTLCTTNCKTLPIAEYAHTAFGGTCVIVGGYVARRSGTPLYGKYIFGDYCSGQIWTIPAGFAAGSPLPSPVASAGFLISSFGESHAGRIYVCDFSNGRIYRITDS
jgi:glucose/arabinose dehydrogenase